MKPAILFAMITLGGCLQSPLTSCGNGFVCPAGMRCGVAGAVQSCVASSCGNGRLDDGEACDDGNNVSGDGCPADCSPACGDGILDPGEVCEPPNSDSCDSTCKHQCGKLGGVVAISPSSIRTP